MLRKSSEHRYKDIKGQRFGRLIAVEYVGHDKYYNAKWRCVCDCGNEKITLMKFLRKGITKSCGCLHREIARNMLVKESGIASFNALYSRYKRDAQRNDRVFELTKDDVVRLTQGSCFYCGKAPSQQNKGLHYNGYYTYNGIDRLNPDLGYTKTNCVTACRQCNFAKQRLTYDEFIELINRIYDHQLKKRV